MKIQRGSSCQLEENHQLTNSGTSTESIAKRNKRSTRLKKGVRRPAGACFAQNRLLSADGRANAQRTAYITKQAWTMKLPYPTTKIGPKGMRNREAKENGMCSDGSS